MSVEKTSPPKKFFAGTRKLFIRERGCRAKLLAVRKHFGDISRERIT